MTDLMKYPSIINCHPFVCRGSDTQFQMGENLIYLDISSNQSPQMISSEPSDFDEIKPLFKSESEIKSMSPLPPTCSCLLQQIVLCQRWGCIQVTSYIDFLYFAG